MYRVYEYGESKFVFEGTLTECRKWLYARGTKLDDGRAIWGTWIENGNEVYDIGCTTLYILKNVK